ncbi:MAG: site-specific integrase [Planctomycetes bacterium]|nr:site-specific integrase [Planctomycetota bacterium]
MAAVYRKTYTRPLSELPPNAEIAQRKDGRKVARWRDAWGRKHAAPLTANGEGVLIQAETYTARYRTASGRAIEAASGCRDKEAAKAFLADLVRREELVRGKVMTRAEADMADAAKSPISIHVEAYLEHLSTKSRHGFKLSADHRANVRRDLDRVVADCGFAALADLSREGVEAWLTDREADGMGASTRNHYAGAIIAFANWCVRTRRLAANPLNGLSRSDESLDRRRLRRALTEEELLKLLDVARGRPLHEAMVIRRGRHKGQATTRVRPDVRQELEAIGRQRALIYATLATTGLRKGELASLTVGHAFLDGARPYLRLSAADAKSRKEAFLPLRHDVAREIAVWLDGRLAARQRAARDAGETIPSTLSPDEPLFRVPRALVKVLRRDLKFAGISTDKDAQGRRLDVHCLRVSFSTLLTKTGAAPRVAQAALRHSTINLTMNTYTDETLLPVAEALEALPVSLPRLLPAPVPQNLAQSLAVKTAASGFFVGSPQGLWLSVGASSWRSSAGTGVFRRKSLPCLC